MEVQSVETCPCLLVYVSFVLVLPAAVRRSIELLQTVILGLYQSHAGSPVPPPSAGPAGRGTSLPQHSPGQVLCVGIAVTAASSITEARFRSVPVVKRGLSLSHLSSLMLVC